MKRHRKTTMKTSNIYVVYGCEQLRDELSEWGKFFNTLDKALAYINKDFFAKDNMTFRLFKLGEEITLTKRVIEEPQPPKKTTMFRVA